MIDPLDDRSLWRRILDLPGQFMRALGTATTVLLWPLRFCLGFLYHLIVVVLDRFEDLEFFVVRLTWLLLWPFRTLGRLLGDLLGTVAAIIAWPLGYVFHHTARKALSNIAEADLAGRVEMRAWGLVLWLPRLIHRLLAALYEILPVPLRTILAAPVVAVAWLTGATLHAFVAVAEAINLDGILAALIRWTWPLWYPIAALFGFVRIWFITRDSRQLAGGLPILLVMIPGIWIAVANLLLGNEAVAHKYRVALQAARDEKDFGRMQLVEKKLAQLGVNTEGLDFRIAAQFAKDGNFDEAYRRMCRLAPEDHPGYPSAHFWILQNILSKHVRLAPNEAQRVAGAHLQQLDALKIKANSLDLLRAIWLAHDNKNEEAAKLLKPLVYVIPAAAELRMQVDLARKDDSEARKDAVAVAEHMDRQRQIGPPLTADDYRCWSIAEHLLGNRAQARSVLRNWLASFPGDKLASELLATESLEELSDLRLELDQDPSETAHLIVEAFAADSVSAAMKNQVMSLYGQRRSNPRLQAVFGMLLTKPEIPPALSESLGTAAAKELDWLVARRFLERTVERDPNNSTAWNNLAFALLKQDKDLDKALAAANTAVNQQPDNLHFRETRGEILVELGRWQEAIADLEFALNGIPNSANIHRSLAKAYESIGNAQLAALHQHSAD